MTDPAARSGLGETTRSVLRRPPPAGEAERGSVTAVHQFLPALLPGDAVGMHTLEMRRALQDAGFASEIFVEAVHAELEGQARHFSEFPGFARGSVLLYQLATGSVLADYVFSRPEPLVIDYHNLTPAEFFRAWDTDVANALGWGRAQLAHLAPRTSLGMADSAYNELELMELDYRRTAVVPILLDVEAMSADVDTDCLAALEKVKAEGGADLLFVGRLAPNKAQHELIKALVMYRRVYDPRARLRLIGRPATDSYARALGRYATELGVADAVIIRERVSGGELSAHYRAADALVIVSEHEGFCVPVLEAMLHGTPIVARPSGAVAETLGRAGLTVTDRSPATVAAAVHRVVTDDALRRSLVAAGHERLAEFDLARSRRRLIEALAPLTGVTP
ncbi:MAG TPA: glycosyltransferase family 4 protein [Acidimicrobiales bacterium]|nr:glycosyltransferase family 4 protein [Acidimicrobiales bacterium]